MGTTDDVLGIVPIAIAGGVAVGVTKSLFSDDSLVNPATKRRKKRKKTKKRRKKKPISVLDAIEGSIL